MKKESYTIEDYYQIYLISCLFNEMKENYKTGIMSFEEFAASEQACIQKKNMVK